uniref:RRM domain-containing protein n=1 Tax=Brassica oleracea var. oleracea TaxID=109376 RepID=A0A0D3DXK6_BRAOL
MSEEGNQKLIHQGSGTIPALADEELMGDDDDDYDDLYSDVNVGEGFFQAHHQPQAPAQVSGGSLHVQSSNVAEPRMAPVSGGAVERKYEEGHSDVQANKVVPQGSTSIVLNTHAYSGNAVNVPEPPQGAKQIPVSQMNVNPNPVVNRSPTQPPFVCGQWEHYAFQIESVLSKYGRVKEIKFFDERVSGKSKGYCQVEFYDSAAAAACKEGMNGFVFNGKACVVAFASPETMKQMGANFTGRNQGQNQIQNRRPLNEGMGRVNNNNMNTQNGGDGGRNYGRGGFARGGGGQGMGSRGGHWGGAMRGRGINNMANGSGAGQYGPSFGGMMHPQGMMGAAGGFDPSFMGRGGGYGGFPHSYPVLAYPGGMPHSYPDENQEKEDNKPSRATTERDWSESSGDRSRHKSHREETDSHREYKQHRDRDSEDRGRQSSSKSRTRSRMAEDGHRSRSRDADYGKRRRGD